MSINEYLRNDNERLEKLIEEHPISLTPNEIAEFMNCDVRNIRAALDSGRIGLAWRKEGALTRGFFIPTPMFVRWYTMQQGFSICS